MSGYIGTQPVPQATQTRQTFTATASQTSFATGGYQAGYLDVFLNGVKLVDGTDYTATNGSDVVLTTGAASGDTLEVVAYTTFEAANVTGADGDFTVDGNLLVGKTSDDGGATQGAEVKGNGFVNFTKSNDNVLNLNRLSSDGDIAVFRKDGSTVGSIGAKSGNLFIGSTNGSDGHLTFGSNIVFPANSSGDAKGDAIDLGASWGRFKDIYLSGGVYLGGTGSDNKLDDVEFGTFNPTIAGSTSTGAPSSYTKREGRYAKMGHLVHVQITLGWSSHTGTGNMSIRDLPFSAVSGGITGQSVLSVGYNAGLSRTADRAMGIYVANGTSLGNFTETAANGDIQGLAIDANVNEIIIAGTYYSQ